MTELTFYRAHDADPGALDRQTVAVVGYGNLGRSIALNLRDSGVAVLVGNVPDDYHAAAVADGFDVRDIAAATAAADIVFVLVPDEVIPACLRDAIAPALRPGAAVCFASGYALAYGLVEPPTGVDVLMIAPRMVGTGVREAYLRGNGFVSYVSVEHDASGMARDRLLALAHATGSLARGAIELPAAKEALLDLFIEQTFGACLGVALQLAFHLGVQAELPAEAMVLELYMSGEMSHTLRDFADNGFYASVTGHGLTATYGGYLRTLALDVAGMQNAFSATLDDIRTGGFAARFQQEQADGYPTLTAIRALTEAENPISAAEQRIRTGLAAHLPAGANVPSP